MGVRELFVFFMTCFLVGCDSSYDEYCRIKLSSVLDLANGYVFISDSTKLSDEIVKDDFFSVYEEFRSCFVKVRPRDTKVIAGNLDIHIRLISLRVGIGLADDHRLIDSVRALAERLSYIDEVVMGEGEFSVFYYHSAFLDENGDT